MKINNFKLSLIFLSLFIFSHLSCQRTSDVIEAELSQSGISSRGMVSASHPLATQAGIEILEMGGNAADAAVAVGFALSVVEPSMSGLGGRMQTILRMPDGELHGIDATTQAPLGYLADTTKEYRSGYKVIGIPGVVAGLTKLLEEHGSLPLETVMGPAIKYAEEGFEVLEDQAQWHHYSKDLLTQFPGSRQYFMKDDSTTFQHGELLVQKDLANTLSLIAEQGKEVFYTGEIAKKIVEDVQANGGFLTMESLAQYEAKDAQILAGDYRGYDLHGLGIPSYGAITIEILNIIEQLPVDEMDDLTWANAFSQAINLAYQDRRPLTSNPDTAEYLISKSHAKTLAQKITLDTPLAQAAIPSSAPESWLAAMGHTTHFSVADKDGMVIASTQSLGPAMGSKVATPGLGFLYAVTLGPYLGVTKEGQRASSHISPFLITKDGQPYLVLGAAGGSRIVSAIVEVASRFIDQQMDLSEALAAARVHPIVDTIYLESHAGIDWDDAGIDALEDKGYFLKEIHEPFRFGRVHAIYYQAEDGQWIGAADPDGAGAAAGPVSTGK